MVVERRQVIFSREELLDAMWNYGERTKRPFDRGRVAVVTFDPEKERALVITAGGTETVFRSDEVGAALIGFCRDNAIPLMKAATKRLEKSGDGAALLIYRDSSRLSVMIVDDQKMVRMMVRGFLTPKIPRFLEAENGEEALKLVTSGQALPDVILCDIHMDKMDGMEFVKRLRANEKKAISGIPVIMLTGDSDSALHQKALAVGANRVVTKPISADDILREVLGLVGRGIARPGP